MTYAVVRFTIEAWHFWPDATGKRVYLSSSHRHLFHMEVRVEVRHDDREIEYHDLLDFCKRVSPRGQLGGSSCEVIAKELLDQVRTRYSDRALEVHCFEDGEVGAIVCIP